MGSNVNVGHRQPWNKGRIVGQKAPFKLKEIWALRVRLQMESRARELVLFNLGIDSKLRGCCSNRISTTNRSTRRTRGPASAWDPPRRVAASQNGQKRRDQFPHLGLLGKPAS